METIYKPTTPGRRGMSRRDFSDITIKKPLKSLTVIKTRGSGRNNQGRITTRHKGGGNRQQYRLISFNLPNGFSGQVEHIEYDPNRSAHIARVKGGDNNYLYILATQNMKVGQKVASGNEAAIEDANRLPLKVIPVGSTIHAIELKPGRGAQIARSAGNSAQLMGRADNGYVQLRMPSGEVRLINEDCTASLGIVGNEQHQNVKIGKAGVNRHRGIRPSVRGVAMNPVDHPHGGGEGRHGVGGGKNHGSAPKTPWGQKTLGYKTRRRKYTNQFIVRSRHAAKRK